ncbi:MULTISPECIES: type I-B CRISPR-associated protein Cas7/Cst2/DevR [unclassified Coleofasciculus]|uniref:type I-B CRISPR-associated protein Cas7/Cst2/DevR n=1 Tax=unclassified Coleofasciculus TaxID=2692782 RepID=UPI00187F95C5|nr:MULTISPECIES: type I-B CRISPR-associated protein Cas7/Cst2/DevR [unclassified Coleofasciculus]MBE9125498.1 type I-B CRISPR-associated protein Cas7/Cst2/DevR [Coleofasciculus sp. LEGE 07081]MBE9148638.1 type I-B CRISPR-associated protein Cas7/Cst2/DevR [Coleofasciculus sp. LEGE 07092]
MTFHLFGNILTGYGTAANNRGENEGNITTLQKLLWKGEVHTTVSAEAIRWALRYYWQTSGGDYQVNRCWDDERNDNVLQGIFDENVYIDDDVLGYMKAEGAKQEKQESDNEEKKKGKKAKGTNTARRGVLEVSRAVSTTPYAGDITFNSASGQKGRTSLYGTEVHATRYQYGFAVTPDRLKDKSRVIAVLDGLVSLGEVAGNHARFLYDFSPESLVLRWTHDFSPRILYCFQEDESGDVSLPLLIHRVEVGDIDPQELWVAGAIAKTPEGDRLEELGVNVLAGTKVALSVLKQAIARDLQLPQLELV